jgi:sortase A
MRCGKQEYPGTANPGQPGNTVLFGHSVLPQFFNPKNYLTIFSTLPTLKDGDEILVNFDGVNYRYLVEEMVEVSPEDTSVLEQRYDDSYITLITCVPPGTYLRRLIVRGRLTVK